MELQPHYPDHFVIGIDNLQKGIDSFQELTGVTAVPGGVHPHIGTCNALVSLGERCYLEIIAPAPSVDHSALDQKLKALFLNPLLQMNSLTPYLWAIGSDDLDLTVGLLQAIGFSLSAPEKGSRQKPDGRPVEWRASFITQPEFPAAPFLIQWHDPLIAPAADSPKGCSLRHFSVSGPQADLLKSIISTLNVNAKTSCTVEPVIEFTFDSPRGPVTLGGSSRLE
jgi:hypothetical protein